MKVKDFAKELKKCEGRLPIAVVDKNRVMRFLSWKFHNDGGGWDSFAFCIGARAYPDLDTDAAKLILDYCLTDPNEKLSFFGWDTWFSDYEIRITHPIDGNYEFGSAWRTLEIEELSIKEIEIITDWEAKTDEPGKKERAFVVLVGDDLPTYKDDDANRKKDAQMRKAFFSSDSEQKEDGGEDV